MAEKLRAELWVDRWRLSPPFAHTDLTAEAQGALRNVLDEMCLRERALSVDEAHQASGATLEEWARVAEVVTDAIREDWLAFLPGPPCYSGELPPTPEHRPHIPNGLREFVLDRDGHQCRDCGATGHLEMDHVYPYSLGGEDSEENLQALCKPCNVRKGARWHGA